MRSNRFQQANVVVDVCDRHGTWFDRNELQQVSSALHARRAPAVASSAAMVAVAAPNASAVADVAGGVACVAVEVAAEAATSTVAEGIADFAIGIVGGIFESIFD